MHEMNTKFTEDSEIISELPIDDDETRLPWTNRRIVSLSVAHIYQLHILYEL